LMTLTFNQHKKISKYEYYFKNDTTITEYWYFPTGDLKRRKITRIPEPEIKGVYVPGPGSDDMSYEYKYDKKGRIKKHYTIVEGKRYRLAKYRYF
jgi:hypothetical protein